MKRIWIEGEQPSRSPEYSAWKGMRRRCYNPASARYADWGGRGIRVCDRWLHSFANFLADMGPRPSGDHSLDRWPDNDGDYEPGNCRWATRSQQQCNKRVPADASVMLDGHRRWLATPEAKEVARQNIRKAHASGASNANAKLTLERAASIRAAKAANPTLRLIDLAPMFGVGRETVRRVLKGVAWTDSHAS